MNLESFISCFVFKLFPIGYGPTPSKRKNIMLKQEVVNGFELVLHRKKENPFERRIFCLQSEWEFNSKWWHTRSLQLFQMSGRCGKDFFKVL